MRRDGRGNLFANSGDPHVRRRDEGGPRRKAKLVGALALDDLDPPDEGSDEDPDDALFRRGFLEVDLES